MSQKTEAAIDWKETNQPDKTSSLRNSYRRAVSDAICLPRQNKTERLLNSQAWLRAWPSQNREDRSKMEAPDQIPYRPNASVSVQLLSLDLVNLAEPFAR